MGHTGPVTVRNVGEGGLPGGSASLGSWDHWGVRQGARRRLGGRAVDPGTSCLGGDFSPSSCRSRHRRARHVDKGNQPATTRRRTRQETYMIRKLLLVGAAVFAPVGLL